MTEDVLQNCRKVDELLRRVINRLCSVLFQQRLHREPERERESNREAIYSKFSYLDMLHNISDLESSSSSEKQNHAVMKFHTSLTVWFASYRQTQTLASVQALLKAAILADVKIGVFGSGAIADCWGQSQLSCVLDNALLMPYSRYPLLPSQLESLCPCQQLYATCRRGDLCPRLGSIPSSAPVVVFLKATV